MELEEEASTFMSADEHLESLQNYELIPYICQLIQYKWRGRYIKVISGELERKRRRNGKKTAKQDMKLSSKSESKWRHLLLQSKDATKIATV